MAQPNRALEKITSARSRTMPTTKVCSQRSKIPGLNSCDLSTITLPASALAVDVIADRRLSSNLTEALRSRSQGLGPVRSVSWNGRCQ